MSDRPGTPPHNVDAEVAVLGAILLHGKDTLVEVQARLTHEDFYVPAHQSLFKAMIALESRGEPIDVITLHHQLKAVGEDRMVGDDLLAKLSDRYATAHNVDSHARIVADLSRLRRFIQTARDLVGRANTEIEDVRGFLDEAEQKVLEVKSNVSDAALRPAGDVVLEVVRNLERRIKSKNPITGVPTGFVKLDEMTAGLQPKDLVIIAARPSMGKTAFALNVTQNVSITAQRHMKLSSEERPQRYPVLFFSLEMGAEQLIERILAAEAKIDYSDLRRGRVMGDDVQRIVRAVDRVRGSPIWIDDRSSPSIVEIRSVARRWRTSSKTPTTWGSSSSTTCSCVVARPATIRRARARSPRSRVG
jgi:replicative DNA helicase